MAAAGEIQHSPTQGECGYTLNTALVQEPERGSQTFFLPVNVILLMLDQGGFQFRFQS